MEETILISYLNDFIFCPISIYFHRLYGNMKTNLYQDSSQINGKYVHSSIDNYTYSTRKDILQGIDVYTEEFDIIGKIDLFNITTGVLTERKRTIKQVYDGYIFQLYAQYYALKEMGYIVRELKIHSMTDNKNYEIKLPTEDLPMNNKFRLLVKQIKEFDMESFQQDNKSKCEKCIYFPACDRGIAHDY